MTKENFLTVQWNNLLSLGLGLIVLVYIVWAFSTSNWSETGGFTGLAILGALYWIIVEQHNVMRFAWLRKNSDNTVPIKQGFAHPLTLIRLAYNVAFWVFLLPFFTSMNYTTGFIIFTVIISVRLCANLYVNFLIFTPEGFERFPLRSP